MLKSGKFRITTRFCLSGLLVERARLERKSVMPGAARCCIELVAASL
jgi:hypothetical protein